MLLTGADGASWLQLQHSVVRVSAGEQRTVFAADSEQVSVLCTALSADAQQLAVATDAKRVHVLRADDGQQLQLVACAKRTALLLYDSAGRLLVADRGGDVTVVCALTGDTRLLLGHLSMLTAATVSPDARLLASGDADGKIRVSRLPAGHSVRCFCLGHQSAIVGLAFLDARRRPTLASLSAGASLRLWDAGNGAQLASVDLGQRLGQLTPTLLLPLQQRRLVCAAAGLSSDEESALCYAEAAPDSASLRLSDACLRVRGRLASASASAADDDGLAAAVVTDCADSPLLLCRLEPDAASAVVHPLAKALGQRPLLSQLAAGAAVRLRLLADAVRYSGLESTGHVDYQRRKEQRLQAEGERKRQRQS